MVFSDNESSLSLIDFLSPHFELRTIESIQFSKSIAELKVPIRLKKTIVAVARTSSKGNVEGWFLPPNPTSLAKLPVRARHKCSCLCTARATRWGIFSCP